MLNPIHSGGQLGPEEGFSVTKPNIDTYCLRNQRKECPYNGIARNRHLGADGWEMRVLLPEFFGGAHGSCNLDIKSATCRAAARGSRFPQAAP
jgi:hypothetical protein